MDRATLRQRVAQLRWFHSIDLGDGLLTPGVDAHTSQRLETFGVPTDLTGRTVLDLGAWDGFFSFEAERRGAARVVAVDSYCWSGPGWGTKAGFDLARTALGSRVEDHECEILDLSPASLGVFDVVFCFGLLYHLRHPLLALEKIAAVTEGLLLLESHVDLLDVPRPAMAFYPGSELAGDGSNWCGPNPACVLAMLHTVGFARAQVHHQTAPVAPVDGTIPSARAVFHAWQA
jgi:tRNA (mo5U34)-methyltransferase